nr:hypothetical protein [uncultured Pseudomonas sp.]
MKLLRDGLDRVIEEHVSAVGSPPLITTYRYDHYSRIVDKGLPDGTCLSWAFAAHSDGQHPETISVKAAEAQA